MNEIEQMCKRIEEYRQERIAQGLPADLPDPNVPIALAAVLVERCAPLYEYLTKYTKLCDDAGQVLPANETIFERYVDYLTLIRSSKHPVNSFGIGMLIASRAIDEAETYDSTGAYVRRLLAGINIAGFGYKRRITDLAYDYRACCLDESIIEEYQRYHADEALIDVEATKLLGGENR